MSENKEPLIKFNYNENEFYLKPSNTSLWQYAGRLATRNHVYYCESDDETYTMFRVFSVSEVYKPLVSALIKYNYPIHTNLVSVSESDETAYQTVMIDVAEYEMRDFDLDEGSNES